uniref:Galactosyltransferase C-terminal domain-containing protein n=1 Tax=viral metagenome TaxID=1070528 RepID=A0A6C0JYY7_9ZZZZ
MDDITINNTNVDFVLGYEDLAKLDFEETKMGYGKNILENTNERVVAEQNTLDYCNPSFQETQNITISIEAAEIGMSTTKYLSVIPKIVFIVPYRNRETQLIAFKSHMKYILEDYNQEDYVIHYIHQTDDRIFNRGAMKNIGFIVVKNKYPNDYKNITLVFNDVDTMPAEKNLFHYDTMPGVVKHFFGFTYTLGGIVSIKAGDFEKVNGFPNFWAWGYEDNLIQRRLEKNGITIDRNIFYKIGDKNIIQKNDEITREVNQSEYDRYLRNTQEGIYSIQNLDYTIDDKSGFVNVKWFNTEYNPNINKYRLHDLRKGPMPYDTKFGMMYNNRRIRGGRMRMGI